MLPDLIKFVHVVHGFELALAAIGFFALWYRTRFWLPSYVHWLAALGVAVGIGLVFLIPDHAPARKLGVLGSSFLIAVCPALVDTVFIFYGGQAAAYQRDVLNARDDADCD